VEVRVALVVLEALPHLYGVMVEQVVLVVQLVEQLEEQYVIMVQVVLMEAKDTMEEALILVPRGIMGKMVPMVLMLHL